MISEISSLLSAADVSLARSGGHKFAQNLNRNRIRSISAYSSNSIFYFPAIVSDQATPEEVTMVSRFLEKSYASFVVACIGLMPFHRIKADDQASIEEYLSQFHQNLGVTNGNGAGIYKAMNVASKLSENALGVTEIKAFNLSQAVLESIRDGVTEEDLAATQDFLQECWNRSRKANTNFINVVNESIVSLHEKFSRDGVDPVTRTLQEAYKATIHELDTWGFLGEASDDMNLWDDMESLSDDELAAIMNPYDGSTIDDLDDDDLEDENPEIDAMLESSWEDIYKKARETMSNSEAVAYANDKFAKAKEVAIQKTKDVGDRIKNGAPKVLKSEAEKLDDKEKAAIDSQIIKESHESGALDRQNAQVAADEKRHQAEDAARQRVMATNARTAVEERKVAVREQNAATAAAKLELEQQAAAQGQNESVGSFLQKINRRKENNSINWVKADTDKQNDPGQTAFTRAIKNNNDLLKKSFNAIGEASDSNMLKAKLDAAKMNLRQTRDNDETPDRVDAAQDAVDDQMVANQQALSQPEVAPVRNEPMSPIQLAAKKAKEQAAKAMEGAQPTVAAPSQNQVAYANQPVAEAASMGQAIESIKYSLQSVSSDKIQGCKSIPQLNKLEAKLKTLRSRYNSYLNRYKKKANAEEKKGNRVIAKLHAATIGDPKAFMLQYGDYIREINARLEMIRRRKKAIAPDIGKPVDESQFMTVTDMDLQAIDYCISEATKMVEAPDDEVFDIVVDESFLSTLAGKNIKSNTNNPKTKTKVASQPMMRDDSYVDPKLLHDTLRKMGYTTDAAEGSINEAKSFDERYESLTKHYNNLIDRMVKNKRFLNGFRIGSINRELTGWTGKGGIIASCMNDEDLAKVEEFLMKRRESGLFRSASGVDETAKIVPLVQKRRQILAQAGMASEKSTIPEETLDAINKEWSDYLKACENAAKERREQEMRLKELEIKQQYADARTAEAEGRKAMGVAAAAAAATYAINSISAKNESTGVMNEAQPSNNDLEFIGTIKKGTGAIKDIYDIIDNERTRASERDRLKFTKDPKRSDPKDAPLYYQNNRQRGNINVAAAANAKPIDGYSGHKTFDREVFTNMDMKKANEAIPTFTKATIGFIVDETEQVVTRDVLIGVKTWIHRAASRELVSDIYNAIINKRKFLQFVKWISGEGTTLSDLLFSIGEMKLDATSTRKPGIGQWLPAFRRRKRLNKIAIPFLMKNYTPNGSVVVCRSEIEFIKSEYGVDVLRPEHVKMLMESSFLLSFVVIDQSNETVSVIYDGQNDFQQYSFSALEREQQSSDRMLRELYRTVSRV